LPFSGPTTSERKSGAGTRCAAQATFLDNGFGTYPYTVAYQTLVQTCFSLIGIPAQTINVLGVMKAYMIRVGNGPFPTELFTEEADYIRERGREYGTVSKRPRRCGWLDLALVSQAVRLNGVTELAITNVDVLAGLPAVYVSTGYRTAGQNACINQALLDLGSMQPTLRAFGGWPPLRDSYEDWQELPAALVVFLRFIESSVGIPIKFISYGPDRKQTLVLDEFGLAGADDDKVRDRVHVFG
jgi:adenylosuccinate synthase